MPLERVGARCNGKDGAGVSVTAADAAAAYVDYRTRAEAEAASKSGSITRAGVYAWIAYLYIIEAQLRAADTPILPPDAPETT
jgi:hypothetical protein